MRYWKTVLVNDYGLNEKLKFLFVESFNVLFTGCLLWYAIEHKNFLSYGLTAALATYYFTFIVEKIGKEWRSK